MAKCTICNSRKGKRKCLIKNGFICSLCCGETRKGDTCGECTYYIHQIDDDKAGRKILIERAKKSDFFEEDAIFVENRNLEKMSEVIMDFVEPILNPSDNYKNAEATIGVAVIVWNAFLLPWNERRQVVKDLIFQIAPSKSKEDLSCAKSLIKFFLRRRGKHFSQYKRAILDYQISRPEGEFYLDVISSLA